MVFRRQPDLLTKSNKEEMTALHIACLSDSVACLKALKKAGHPLSIRSSKGFPLHLG